MVVASFDLLFEGGKLGLKVGMKLMKHFDLWPCSSKEGVNYCIHLHNSTISTLRDAEKKIEETMAISISSSQIDLSRKMDRLRGRIQGARNQMENTATGAMENLVKDKKIRDTLSMLYLALMYDAYVVNQAAMDMSEYLEDEEIHEAEATFKKARASGKTLDQVWNIRAQASADPKVADVLYKQLQQAHGEFVQFVENLGESSRESTRKAWAEVVISKPRCFGKNSYKEALGELIWKSGERIDADSISLSDLALKLKEWYPKVEFQLSDINGAAQWMVETKRAHALTVRDNVQMLEFSKSDMSYTCDNCGKSGGLFNEFRSCQMLDKTVCGDCISFLSKCKICGNSVKHQHPVLTYKE